MASARSRSKPAQGAREAGPRGICVGGPSAELTSEPHIALSRLHSPGYIESVASRGGRSEARLAINFAYILVHFGRVLHLDLHRFSRFNLHLITPLSLLTQFVSRRKRTLVERFACSQQQQPQGQIGSSRLYAANPSIRFRMGGVSLVSSNSSGNELVDCSLSAM
ncbi:hypothetical protein JG687_00017690 [Phytophthora cactorum]|uniref:Uncharacterized protein n=1 Tax=Phytophthora cactorum TaxID=29920 RepID=A0A8T1TQR0_9STRA|nr:hypothetical protein JG687_00017690 [Phytophthora cactorum]